jgi:hypothetical protein
MTCDDDEMLVAFIDATMKGIARGIIGGGVVAALFLLAWWFS